MLKDAGKAVLRTDLPGFTVFLPIKSPVFTSHQQLTQKQICSLIVDLPFHIVKLPNKLIYCHILFIADQCSVSFAIGL